MTKYLYHLTSKSALPEIINSGLIPKIGERSESAGEVEPFVYLCDKKDIPYWKILTGQDAAVRISLEGLEKAGITPEAYQWDGYGEWTTKQPIPASCISVYRMSEIDTTEAMRNLCISFLYAISSTCILWARCLTNRYMADYVPESLRCSLRCCRICLPRLDYGCLSEGEIRKELEQSGREGSYTFCDKFDCTERRVWETLTDDFPAMYYDDRVWLHDYIVHTFTRPRCKYPLLMTETGAWY